MALQHLLLKDREELARSGHVLLPSLSSENFDLLASSLGKIIPSRTGGPLKDTLQVMEKEEASTRSLSKQFGKSRFPLHTDLAHLPIPPRYILLRSVGEENSRKTYVMDVCDVALAPSWKVALEHDIWFVDGGRGAFFSPVLNKTIVHGSTIFRYDSQVMRPADRVDFESIAVIQHIKMALPLKEYVLKQQQCLVIDNWRTLHGRGAEPAVSDKDTRLLERYLVEFPHAGMD